MEIVGEYGGITGGGDLSPEFVYGVPYETWVSWSRSVQQEWLVDWNRTEAQANYYRDSPQATAYEYMDWADELVDKTQTYYEDVTDFGQEKIGDAVSILIGLGALYLVTRK
jgi:hypothetical protein